MHGEHRIYDALKRYMHRKQNSSPNTKYEILNPKQIQITQIQNPKNTDSRAWHSANNDVCVLSIQILGFDIV